MRKCGVVSLIAFVATVTACGGAQDAAPEVSVPNFAVDPISWDACEGDDAPEDPFECATVQVPLNYEQPDDALVELAVIRIAATEKRRGVILTNPGGPGGSGFDFVVGSGQEMVRSLELEQYDLIGFDPRGVDRSGGIRCISDEVADTYLYVDATPDTEQEQKLYDESEDIFENGCRAKYGDAIDYYSTVNTAHDIDVIRRAVDVEAISYIGISYGTYLGGVYATIYPENFEAMFLDAAFDPQGDSLEDQYLTQIRGFEEAFNSWATWCQTETSCAFRAADVGKRWDELLEQVDQNPLQLSSGREVNNAVMEEATIQSLYARSYWPLLATALDQLEKGNGEEVLRIADLSKGRNPDGTFNTIEQSNPVIRCASGFGRDEPDNPEELVKKLKEAAPRFAKDITAEDFEGNTCDGLTEDADLMEISYSGSAPIVVVGGENDPATPIRWAEEMVENLGDGARLVRFTGEGHSQLLASSCVDAIAADIFSEDAKLPEQNKVCSPDEPIARPNWFDDVPPPSPQEELLDASIMGPLVGIAETEIYAEYRSSVQSPSEMFRTYKEGLESAGFTVGDSEATGAVDEAQFFFRDGQTLALLIIDQNGLEEALLYQPNGPVKQGHSLLILAFVPNE